MGEEPEPTLEARPAHLSAARLKLQRAAHDSVSHPGLKFTSLVVDAAAKAGVGLTRLDSRHVEKHGLQDGEALQRNHLDYANHKTHRQKTIAGEPPAKSGLSACTILSYAAPSFSTVPIQFLLSVYVIQFYELLGGKIPVITFFMAIGRSIDCISDPVMSYVTDSCRSKHGRRRPFLMLGCVPYSVLLVLLLFPPPSLGDTGVSIWFGICYIMFFLLYTFNIQPYDAWAPEMTDNPKDQTTLFFTCTMFDGLGSLLAAILPIGLHKAMDIFYEPVGCLPADSLLEGVLNTARCYHISNHLASPVAQNFQLTDTDLLLPLTTTDALTTQCETVAGQNLAPAACECFEVCRSISKNENMRSAYLCVGSVFGGWFLVTMLVTIFTVKERSHQMMKDGQLVTDLPPPAPMVPSSLKTFANKPFLLLLPAWVCDALVAALIGSLLTFFVRYVVEPEFTDGFGYGGEPDGTPNCRAEPGSTWKCDSTVVLGMCVMAVLCGALLFTPMWKLFARDPVEPNTDGEMQANLLGFGKRNTWLLWSATTAVTTPLFILVGKGDVMLCILIAGINGIPMGAKFLADDILADVIDYGEFLTGQRTEATYTMFKSFIPKVASLPASVLPIALLDSLFDHKGPVAGVIQEQTDGGIKTYLHMVVVMLPTCLSILAFVFKLRYPLRTTEDIMKVKAAIGRHKLAVDWETAARAEGSPFRTDPATQAAFVDPDFFVIPADYLPNGKAMCGPAAGGGPAYKAAFDGFQFPNAPHPKHKELEAKGAHNPEWLNYNTKDPVSLIQYNLVIFDNEAKGADGRTDQDHVDRLDYFLGTEPIDLLLEDWDRGAAAIRRSSLCQLVPSVLLLLGSVIGVALTFDWLFKEDSTPEPVTNLTIGGAAVPPPPPPPADADYSFVVTLLVIMAGVSMNLVAITAMRTRAAFDVAANPIAPAEGEPAGENARARLILTRCRFLRSQIARAQDLHKARRGTFLSGIRRPVSEGEQAALVSSRAQSTPSLDIKTIKPVAAGTWRP